MTRHLSVGFETNCIAPLWLERVLMRTLTLAGVDSLFVPDHYLSFVPRSVWGPTLTPAALNAGLRHLVIWNIGPLATGAGPADMLRLAQCVRRLRKLGVEVDARS